MLIVSSELRKDNAPHARVYRGGQLKRDRYRDGLTKFGSNS